MAAAPRSPAAARFELLLPKHSILCGFIDPPPDCLTSMANFYVLWFYVPLPCGA